MQFRRIVLHICYQRSFHPASSSTATPPPTADAHDRPLPTTRTRVEAALVHDDGLLKRPSRHWLAGRRTCLCLRQHLRRPHSRHHSGTTTAEAGSPKDGGSGGRLRAEMPASVCRGWDRSEETPRPSLALPGTQDEMERAESREGGGMGLWPMCGANSTASAKRSSCARRSSHDEIARARFWSVSCVQRRSPRRVSRLSSALVPQSLIEREESVRRKWRRERGGREV